MSKPAPNTKGQTITIHELMEQSARSIINVQRDDGSFPPSCNGIYDESETPVRMTSHWLTTLSMVYTFTGENEFAEAANDAADYLLSDDARPYDYTFHSRDVPGKDKCDGLIGQAAPIRALVSAGESLDRPELIDLAIEAFMIHPYHLDLGLWETVEIDGTKTSFDRTLNHQLLFAAAGATLAESSDEVAQRVYSFLTSLGTVMKARSDGLVMHYIRPPGYAVIRTNLRTPRHWPLIWNDIAARLFTNSTEFRRKEVGYHLTVLAALALLHRHWPGHSVWDHPQICAARKFVDTEEYKRQVATEYSEYGSMLPGITHALFLNEFENPSIAELEKYVEYDIHRKYNSKTKLLSKNAVDERFQASLVYRLGELDNFSITLPIDEK